MAPEMQGLLAQFSVCAGSQLPLEEKLAPRLRRRGLLLSGPCYHEASQFM